MNEISQRLLRPRSKRFALFLLLTGILAGSLRSMSDPDIWFQLLAAREVLRSGVVPQSEFFVYAGFGAPQVFAGWGLGMLYLLPIEIFGLQAATIVNSAIWGATFWLALEAARMRAARRWAELSPVHLITLAVAVAMLFVVLSVRMTMRAEQTLILAWCLSLWIAERSAERNTAMPFLCCLPIIAWIEAWLHSGGFVLLALIPIGAARLMQRTQCRYKNVLFWGLLSVVTALLPALNPNGQTQVYVHLQSMLLPDPAPASHRIAEYLPIWHEAWSGLYSRYALLTTALLVTLLRPNSAFHLIEWTICAVFLAIAALHVRGISLACMAMMVPLLEVALHPRLESARIKESMAIFAASLLCLIPLLSSLVSREFGIQGATGSLQLVADRIRQIRPAGTHMLTLEDGPQLLFLLRDHRYLSSSRSHTIIPNKELDRHLSSMMDAAVGWEEELDHYSVDLVCVPIYGGNRFLEVTMALASSRRWKYHNPAGTLLILERLPHGRELGEQDLNEQMIAYFSRLMNATAQFALTYQDEHAAIINRLAAETLRRETALRIKHSPNAG